MTRRFLSASEVAERTGMSAETIRSYTRDGYMPAPDAVIGRTSGWTERTIDAWAADRPGKVGRPRKSSEIPA